MDQLKLDVAVLEEIGFVKTVHPSDEFNPEQVTYDIPILNGCFYYNESDDHYRWYQVIQIGDGFNHIHLHITQAPALFTILKAFNAKCKLVIV